LDFRLDLAGLSRSRSDCGTGSVWLPSGPSFAVFRKLLLTFP
jgi:hypothetical protein